MKKDHFKFLMNGPKNQKNMKNQNVFVCGNLLKMKDPKK
jgi:hypothetical protein